MANKNPLLLTSIEGIPIIIRCDTVEDVFKFKKKGSQTISQDVFDANADAWCQNISNPDKTYIAYLLNTHVGEYDCWIRKSDAE
jgi:hypothetical protein